MRHVMTGCLVAGVLAVFNGCGSTPLKPVPAATEFNDYYEEAGTRPASPTPAGTRFHVVQKGDTLYGIAVKYYGNGKYWENIRAVNPAVKDSRSLNVGTELVIPPIDLSEADARR